MKATMVLIVLLAVPASPSLVQAQRVVDYGVLVERGGLKYEVNSESPFTGTAIIHWPNGRKMAAAEFRDGQQNGKMTEWYENGQKFIESEWRDGKLHGKKLGWYDNGRKLAEGEYRNGEPVAGTWTIWDGEGNVISREPPG